MTLRGFFTLVFELFLLIMALGTDIREFLIVAVCIGGLWCYSFISVLLAVITLKFSSTSDKYEFCRGEDIVYTLQISGPVILPVVGKIKVLSADNGDITDKALLRNAFLLSWALSFKRKYCFNMRCEHTGYWNIGIEKFRVSDIFGMFSSPLFRTPKSKHTARIGVLPKSHKFYLNNYLFKAERGLTGANLQDAENGEILGDSRIYKEGDALKRINWKMSIRTRKLYTRRYELPREPEILIAIDSAVGSDFTGTIADIYRETALSLAEYYVDCGYAVRIATLRDQGEKCQLDKQYSEMSDIFTLNTDLIDIKFRCSHEKLDIFRLDNGVFLGADNIYILSSTPGERLLSAMADVIEKGKRVTCVMPDLSEEPLAALKTAIENTGVLPVVVGSTEEIAQKVGGAIE